MIPINGTNLLMDQMDSFILLSFIVVILKFFGPNFILYKNDLFFNNILIILSFLILNVLNKIYLGDGGSYLIGFLCLLFDWYL